MLNLDLITVSLHRYAVDEFGQIDRLLGVRRDRRAKAWMYLRESSDLSSMLCERERGAAFCAARRRRLSFEAEWTPYWFGALRAQEQDVIYCDSLNPALDFARLRRLLWSRRGLDSCGGSRGVDRIIADRAARYADRRLRRLATQHLDAEARVILTAHLEAARRSSMYREAANGNDAAERARTFLKAHDASGAPFEARAAVAWLRPRCATIEAMARATPGVTYAPAAQRHILRWRFAAEQRKIPAAA